MDDLIPKHDPSQDAIKREMYRQSEDMIRVFNPTNSDYIVLWDKWQHIVPAQNKDIGWGKGQKSVKRYIASKYYKEMGQKLFDLQVSDAIFETNEKRRALGQEELEKNYFDRGQYMLEAKMQGGKEEFMAKILDILILGVDEEFAIDNLPDPGATEDGKIDARSMEQRLFDKMNKRYVSGAAAKQVEDKIPTLDDLERIMAPTVPTPSPKEEVTPFKQDPYIPEVPVFEKKKPAVKSPLEEIENIKV